MDRAGGHGMVRMNTIVLEQQLKKYFTKLLSSIFQNNF